MTENRVLSVLVLSVKGKNKFLIKFFDAFQ